MDDHNNENRIIDPHRDEWRIEEETHNWIRAASAAILLISALAAIFKRWDDENKRRYLECVLYLVISTMGNVSLGKSYKNWSRRWQTHLR